MDTYIVHVYRRESEHRLVSGLAERVQDGAKQGFRTIDELWTFLVTVVPPVITDVSENNPEDSR